MNAKHDDWIETNGIEPSVPDGARVQLRFRNGYVTGVAMPQGWRWSDRGGSYDIVAYRIAKAEQE